MTYYDGDLKFSYLDESCWPETKVEYNIGVEIELDEMNKKIKEIFIHKQTMETMENFKIFPVVDVQFDCTDLFPMPILLYYQHPSYSRIYEMEGIRKRKIFWAYFDSERDYKTLIIQMPEHIKLTIYEE